MKHVTIAVVGNHQLARELAQMLARYVHVVVDAGDLRTSAARRMAIAAQLAVVGPGADTELLAARLYDVRLFNPGLRVLCLDADAAERFAPAETVDLAALLPAILSNPPMPAPVPPRTRGWRLFQRGIQ